MHNEFLDVGSEKMSKSKGHVLTVDTLVDEGIDPLAFRYFFFQAHYRQQQSFTIDLVRSAGTALRRIVHHAVVAREAVGGDASGAVATRTEPHRTAFWAALADDLNAPKALAVVATVARSTDLTDADRWSLLSEFDQVLGFGLAEAVDPEQADEGAVDDPRIAELLGRRTAARAAKDWAEADRIRDVLAAEGLEIVDTADGPEVRRR
jgi:cysteinyl-tRNA synthetase